MQGHSKVRGSTATSKPHVGRKRDLKKKVSILLPHLIILSSMSWLYTTKEIQTISYWPTIAYMLPKYEISSCLPSMFPSMLAELSKFCRASPQSSVHTFLTSPLPLSFITMFYAYLMLCRRSLGLIAVKYAQRHGLSSPSVHAVLINVNMSAMHLFIGRNRKIPKST